MALFDVVPLRFIQSIDCNIPLTHFMLRLMFPPFFAIFSGHLEFSTPFPTEITTFLEIAHPNVRKLSRIIFFSSLRVFLLEQKLHMAWQQNLAKAMASPRKLQHDTSKKKKKIVNTKRTYI